MPVEVMPAADQSHAGPIRQLRIALGIPADAFPVEWPAAQSAIPQSVVPE
jgi:hypothetical protein